MQGTDALIRELEHGNAMTQYQCVAPRRYTLDVGAVAKN
jgi:hypothetical protein